MYNNIPNELRLLNQWVVWKFVATDDGKPTKLPYNPRNGHLASTTDPHTWASFEDAVNASFNGYSGIGFVFTRNDPYCGIDLDATEDPEAFATQLRVFNAMQSYSERSPSGKGLHIIVKANLPHGRRRSFIEVYSSERYFTFTGNVYLNAPIEERQALTYQLWEEMGQGSTVDYYAGDASPAMFDDQLIEQMQRAVNGDLFADLWAGNWQHRYASQSEADQALMNFLVYHTKNRPQCVRLFRQSALGQRDKAQRDKYVEYTLNKAFDQSLPPIDMDGIVNQVNAAVAQARQAATPQIAQHDNANTGSRMYDGFNMDLWRTEDPPGLTGEIMRFIYAHAPRPVREIALMGAFGLMSGITGRAYNHSRTGLNQYLMLLAPTGRGKEAISSGINILASAVAATDFPAIWNFIGPTNMASGTGLLRELSERDTPCFVSLTGEIGLRLQQMSNDNANAADITLRRVLLDLYMKSGAGSVLPKTAYADKKNNVELINSPAFTWLGESTPEEFYKSLSENQIASGLLPRFTIIEYNGPRVPMNDNHASIVPSHNLVMGLRGLADIVLKTMQERGQVINVQFTQQATIYERQFNTYCDDKVNSASGEAFAQLWSRAHIKVTKMASIIAAGLNPHAPVVDHHMVEWAASLVLTDVVNIIRRFEKGDVGEAENYDDAQIEAMRRNIKSVLLATPGTLSGLLTPMHANSVLPYRYIMQRCSNLKPFKLDRRGNGVQRTVKTLVDMGALAEVAPAQIVKDYQSTHGRCYVVNRPEWFLT